MPSFHPKVDIILFEVVDGATNWQTTKLSDPVIMFFMIYQVSRASLQARN